MKKQPVLLAAEVLDELENIYHFIAKDSISRAKILYKELKKKIDSLGYFPGRGTKIQGFDFTTEGPIRFIEYKGYIIIYQVRLTEVFVLHVYGPGENWKLQFLN